MTAILKSKQLVCSGYTLFILESKEIASAARPGQFLMVRTGKGSHPAMRKPLSVFCAEGDTFGLLVKNAGYGTELMTRWNPGEEIDIAGPRGQGFRYTGEENDFILVAGGIGLAPLNFLGQQLADKGKNVHLLFAPKRDAMLMGAFTVKTGVTVHYTGNRHTVADDLGKIITALENPCGVFTCGPNGFIKLVAQTAQAHGLQTQASLESRMSCGMGVCLGCVVAVRGGDDWVYKNVCRDGPVFDAGEVIFE